MADDYRIITVPDAIFSQLQRNMANAPQWMPKVISKQIRYLGPRVSRVMREAVLGNRYKGALDESVGPEYSDAGQTVTISPKAMRGGKYDAGNLLELGVPHPIPNLPYAPIAAWANFRGAPMPAVWLGMRAHGVKAHPFLDRTLKGAEVELNIAQVMILDAMIDEALRGALPG